MKRTLFPDRKCWVLIPAVLILVLFVPKAKATTSWTVQVGAQNKDASRQDMGFLPNEIWINAGDDITWTSKVGEAHTVTLLKQTAFGAGAAGTTRPSNGTSGATGCADGSQGGTATIASPTSFDGTGCVNSGPICDDTLQQANPPESNKCFGWTAGPKAVKTYKITFPTAGNFKLVCLIHADMTGTIHVLSSSATLPHHQWFYDDLARDQARNLISDADNDGKDIDDQGDSSRHVVITPGELHAAGGGKQYLAVMRFIPSTIRVNVGDTVEWVDTNPAEPHTVTFVGGNPANEPGNPMTTLGLISGPIAVTATSESGNTVTVTSTLNPPVGSTVSIAGVTPAGYNGSFLVVLNGASSFMVSNPTSGLGAGTAFGTASVFDADGDGDVEGILASPSCAISNIQCVFSSGFITPAAQEQTSTVQKSSVTRARVTFTHAGVYDYFCILHDELGMEGKVIVGDAEDNDNDRR